MAEPIALKYRAFISYSHAADGRFAELLPRELLPTRFDEARRKLDAEVARAGSVRADRPEDLVL